MSDIVERLRAWVYTDSQYATAREAADEIERLRGQLSGSGNQVETGQPVLTDAEREAIAGAIESEHWRGAFRWAATLKGLLERTK
jgi:hypothetical protein